MRLNEEDWKILEGIDKEEQFVEPSGFGLLCFSVEHETLMELDEDDSAEVLKLIVKQRKQNNELIYKLKQLIDRYKKDEQVGIIEMKTWDVIQDLEKIIGG